jgi:hypothetical protein
MELQFEEFKKPFGCDKATFTLPAVSIWNSWDLAFSKPFCEKEKLQEGMFVILGYDAFNKAVSIRFTDKAEQRTTFRLHRQHSKKSKRDLGLKCCAELFCRNVGITSKNCGRYEPHPFPNGEGYYILLEETKDSVNLKSCKEGV